MEITNVVNVFVGLGDELSNSITSSATHTTEPGLHVY